MYHVTARELTDGRADTGGWGSATGKAGNYIQASYVHPVYVTSFTVAGGLILSWGTQTNEQFGSMDLQYSVDSNNTKTWHKVKMMEIYI